MLYRTSSAHGIESNSAGFGRLTRSVIAFLLPQTSLSAVRVFIRPPMSQRRHHLSIAQSITNSFAQSLFRLGRLDPADSVVRRVFDIDEQLYTFGYRRWHVNGCDFHSHILIRYHVFRFPFQTLDTVLFIITEHSRTTYLQRFEASASGLAPEVVHTDSSLCISSGTPVSSGVEPPRSE